MQDFRNFPLYLTARLWEVLESSTATVTQLRKAELLCNYLVQSLGLRHASEPTQSVIVALIGRRMEVPQQTALLQTIKSVLRTVVARARNMGVQLPADTYLDLLPAGPDALPAAYRAYLDTLQIVPVPSSVNMDEIWQMARGTPLRGRNQQILLQQAVQGQGQGLVGSTGNLAVQQQLLTQTASMMVQAMVGVMQPRQEESSLRNLRLRSPVGNLCNGFWIVQTHPVAPCLWHLLCRDADRLHQQPRPWLCGMDLLKSAKLCLLDA